MSRSSIIVLLAMLIAAVSIAAITIVTLEATKAVHECRAQITENRREL